MLVPTSLGMRLLKHLRVTDEPDNGVYDGHATGNKSRPAHSFETAPSLVHKLNKAWKLDFAHACTGESAAGASQSEGTVSLHSAAVLLASFPNSYVDLETSLLCECVEVQQVCKRGSYY